MALLCTLAAACSGAFIGESRILADGGGLEGGPNDDSALLPDGARSEAGQFTDGRAPTDARAPDATSDATADANADAAADAGCVEPEPNGTEATAPQLPLNFTCGILKDVADLDYYTRTAVAGDRAFRIVTPGGAFDNDLMVTVRLGGTTVVFSGGDTLSNPTVGTKYTFEAKLVGAKTNVPYGILVDR
jgi:hypothetical protein